MLISVGSRTKLVDRYDANRFILNELFSNYDYITTVEYLFGIYNEEKDTYDARLLFLVIFHHFLS